MTENTRMDGNVSSLPIVGTRISVLVACHNRRELTLRSIRAVHEAAPAGVGLDLFLTDDGSTDGTAAAVLDEFPQTHIIAGDGNLYWNGGMRAAWQAALETEQDFFLWLNDDLVVDADALSNVLAEYDLAKQRYGEKVIIVGRTINPTTRETTYGGFILTGGGSKLSFRHLRDGESVCSSMNGNLVLIPARAAQDVGILSNRYTHTFADVDYGLRAGKAGYTILQASRPVGYQERNAEYFRKISTLTGKNWRFVLLHPKGLPWREWLYFCQQHGGWMWPINFSVRYLKLVRAGLRSAA